MELVDILAEIESDVESNCKIGHSCSSFAVDSP